MTGPDAAAGRSSRRGGCASGWQEPWKLDPDPEGPEPAYAAADAWSPPHPLALPRELCVRVREAARRAPLRRRSLSGTYVSVDDDLDPADRQQVTERLEQANGAWWALAITEWEMVVKRYTVGDEHAEHQDLYAGAARRKLGGIAQLSDPGDYQGGELSVRLGDQRTELPRDLGTLAVWPGWTLHQVEPVTDGERWVLAVFGYGPRLQ